MPSPYSRPYKTGTVSIESGSTALVGTGTAWQVSETAPLLLEGDELSLNGIIVPIASIDGNANATLELPWPGDTVTNGAYAIIKRSLKRFSPAEAQDRATKFLLQLQGMTPVYHVQDDETVPDPSRGEDGDVALKITAGVWRLWRYIDGDGWVEQSPAAGVAAGIRLAYDDSTSDADPGAGEFRLNHATPASATAAYIDNVDAAGATISGILDLWDDSTSTVKGILRFQHETDPDIWAQFQVTGSVVDGTGYRKLTLANGQGSGAFTAADKFSMLFVRSGDKGETGSATASSDVAWTSDISPSSLSADQDDYNPTGLSGASVIRHAASAEVAINGSAGGADGRLMIDANISAYALKRNAERASSTAVNRNAGPDIEIDPGAAGLRIYDATTQRWRPVAPRLKPLHLHAQPDPFPTVPHKPTVYANWSTMHWLDRYFTFTRASVASYLDKKGILRYAPAGVPRFHTIYSSGECGLLIEGARTNLLLRSEDLSTTWTVTAATAALTTNAGIAPDGQMTADLLTEDTDAASIRSISQGITITAGQTITTSLFVKRAAGSRHLRIQLSSDAGANGFRAYFDLTSISVSSNESFGTGTAIAAGIEVYPNGWYRLSVTGLVAPAATSVSVVGFIQQNAGGGAAYDGDGTSGFYFWGMQAEVGAFPSSYIPTTSATVTRAADVCTRSNADNYINAEEMTLFCEALMIFDDNANFGYGVTLDDLTSNEVFGLRFSAVTDVSQAIVIDGGVSQTTVSKAYTVGTAAKLACALKLNDLAYTSAGAAVAPDTSVTLPTVTTMTIGSRAGGVANSLFGIVKRIAYWPRRLPDAQLQTVTT